MATDKILIHAQFNPRGRVVNISECPPWAEPQQWFDILRACSSSF